MHSAARPALLCALGGVFLSLMGAGSCRQRTLASADDAAVESVASPSDPESVLARSEVEKLKGMVVHVRTSQAADDFSDLAPLKEALAGVRIIQLGEQTHGDGATFEAKVRLIKFLHQEMGFGVVAFESGLYDCHKAWEQIRAGSEGDAAARSAIFALWSESAQVHPLWEYLASNANADAPLVLAGFDSQFTGRFSEEELVKELGTVTGRPDLAMLMQTVVYPQGGKTNEAERQRIRDAIETMITKPVDSDADFWKQVLRSTAAQAESQWKDEDGGAMAMMSMASNNARDRQMADNLIWLAKSQHPDRKIIVWGASMHLIHNAPTLQERGLLFGRKTPYEGLLNMGHFVAEEFGDKAYTIGFIAHEGNWAWAGGNGFSGVVPPAPTDSFEDLFFRAGVTNGFLDLRGNPAWNQERVARPMGYAEMLGDWTKIVDGFFFTRQMTPSTPIQ